MLEIKDKVTYTFETKEKFKDGNLPPGFQSFEPGDVFKAKGPVARRLLESGGDCFNVSRPSAIKSTVDPDAIAAKIKAENDAALKAKKKASAKK